MYTHEKNRQTGIAQLIKAVRLRLGRRGEWALLRIEKHAGQEIRVLVRLSPQPSQFLWAVVYDIWDAHFDDHEVCLDITGGEDYVCEWVRFSDRMGSEERRTFPSISENHLSPSLQTI